MTCEAASLNGSINFFVFIGSSLMFLMCSSNIDLKLIRSNIKNQGAKDFSAEIIPVK